LSVCFPGIDAATLLAEIGDRVAASAGAACHADGVELSTVLKALQMPVRFAMGTVRFSVGRTTTEDDIDTAIEIVASAAEPLAGGEIVAAATEGPEGVALTRFTHGMGCACKLRPAELEQILRTLPATEDPNVLIDASTSDDAAVYRIRDDLAIVQTVDFFTPIADDPYDFGAISAANSLSDLYAMGAQPIFALSIVGFPTKRLPLDVLERIMQGAADVAREAGIEILGGHSVEDNEPKFGLAATGIVHPEQILTNAGAQPGDVLVLTKPIGTGIIATAAKLQVADLETATRALETMRRLNRSAAETMVEVGARACTDVTGFGLLGHLREMSVASGLDVELYVDAVPVLDGVRELAASDVVPGGTIDNLQFVSGSVDWPPEVSKVRRLILADAQTSGGLLMAVPRDRADHMVEALVANGVEAARIIGRFTGFGAGRIRVMVGTDDDR
jgi:selenium donor protein